MGFDNSRVIGGLFKYLQYKYGKRNTCHTRYSGQHHAFRKNLLQNVFRTGTYGTAYSYFRCALLDGYHHDIRYADSSGKQRPQTYHPDKKAHSNHQVIHHGEHSFRIQKHDGLFVIGSNVVRCFYKTFHFGLHVFHFYSRFHDETYYMQFLSEVVGLLHGGKRQCNGFRGLPLYIDIAFG